MKIETVVVFQPYDIDREKKTLVGMSLQLLNAVDRIELAQGSRSNINIPKSLFAKENWFETLLALNDA